MNKWKWILFPLLVGVLATACTPDQEPADPRPDQAVEEEVETTQENTPPQPEFDVEAAFHDLLDQEPLPKDLMAFLNENLLASPLESANSMVLTTFDQVMAYASDQTDDLLDPDLQALSRSEFRFSFDTNRFSNIRDVEFLKRAQQLVFNGAKIVELESYYVVVPNADEFIRQYGNEISEDTLAYIRLISDTSLEPSKVYSLSGRSGLADQIAAYERFLDDYPNFPRNDEVRLSYEGMVQRYMLGDTELNTFDGVTGNLLADVRASYAAIQQHYAGTAFAKRVEAFETEIDRTNSKYTTTKDAFVRLYPLVFSHRTMRLDEVEEGLGSRKEIRYPQFTLMENTIVQDRMNNQIFLMIGRMKRALEGLDEDVYRSRITYDVQTVDKDKLTIVVHAHVINKSVPQLSYSDRTAATFDLATGSTLTLDDQFRTDSHIYLAALNRVLQQQLDEQEKEVETYPVVTTETPYMLREDHLELIFPAGVYKKNAVQFAIPKTDIQQYLK